MAGAATPGREVVLETDRQEVDSVHGTNLFTMKRL
jgi:hypothetical protein